MQFKIGDLVTRKSYNNDVVFKIINIENEIYYLKGVNIRLLADCEEKDLLLYNKEDSENIEFEKRIKPIFNLNRNDYFYIPGKILHIDSDIDYLERCLNYYKEANINVQGINSKEQDLNININKWLNKYKPDIIVITGHDALYNNNTYKNSQYFIDAVKEARKYEKSHDKLIIIAGACQSNYEDLIKAGANFASSPKRVNIHALDPAIIATRLSLSDVGKDIDVKKIIELTKYGSNGIGGVITKGTMYTGYPR